MKAEYPKTRYNKETMLVDLTLEAVRAESIRAQVKHGDKGMLNPAMPNDERLATLVEEVGEVAELLTYDKRQAAGDQWKDMLVSELIQVANVALSWAQVADSQSYPNLYDSAQ